MEKITKVSQIEKYKDYPLKDIVENLEIDIYWIKPKYPELYEKIKEFRKTYKKCISCKKYFLPVNKETFCKNQKCQEFKKERSTKIKQKARNTNLEKYGVEYYVNIDKRKKTNLEKYGNEEGHDHFHMTHPDTEWKSCIAHAVKIGLGTSEYELITI